MDMPPPATEYVAYVDHQQHASKSKNRVRNEVRSAYGQVANANKKSQSCGNGRSCCGISAKKDPNYSQELGYTLEDLNSVPDGCDMGLGCGNPQVIAALQPGETVLDLGSGGGFDVFLAAKKVGNRGKVYGVDMTPDMLSQSRENAKKHRFDNVEFLLGEIEHLPLPNDSVDVVMSNCVVNLSPDKEQVFSEVYRVLKKGGRIAISDIVAYKPLPIEMVNNEELYCNCISGASSIDSLKGILRSLGFSNIKIEPQKGSRMFIKDWVPGADAENYVVSAKITAEKLR